MQFKAAGAVILNELLRGDDAGMAEYDLTQRMASYLDCHLVFPLLDFLQERQVYPDRKILYFRMELLMETSMVDHAWCVHKCLFNSKEVPKNMVDKKIEVDAKLRVLEGQVAPIIRALKDANALRRLATDRDHYLQMLLLLYKIGQEQIHILYEYAKFQFMCGKYSIVARYLDLYILLSTKLEFHYSAIWGKLAAEILLKNWNTALRYLYKLKEIIESGSELLFETPTFIVTSILWLLHSSLFVFFNHDNGIIQLVGLFNQDMYFTTIQINAPHLFRYLAVAFIITKSGKPQFENFIKVVQSGQCSYEDPITEFFTSLYVNDNFDDADAKMDKCVEVMMNDPFLGKRAGDGRYLLIDEFRLSARPFIFENCTKMHQPVDKSALAMGFNWTGKDGERSNAIQDCELDVGIDLSKEIALMNPNDSNMFIRNQLIDNRLPMTIEEPSFDNIAALDSFFPAIDNENQGSVTSIFQPFPLLDPQPTASLFSSRGIGYSPFASSYLSGVGLHQNNNSHWGPSGIEKVVDDYSWELGLKMNEDIEMTGINELVNRDDVNSGNKRKEPIADVVEKHCSCGETRCLEIRCGCFRARRYCVETCACQECHKIY